MLGLALQLSQVCVRNRGRPALLDLPRHLPEMNVNQIRVFCDRSPLHVWIAVREAVVPSSVLALVATHASIGVEV